MASSNNNLMNETHDIQNVLQSNGSDDQQDHFNASKWATSGKWLRSILSCQRNKSLYSSAQLCKPKAALDDAGNLAQHTEESSDENDKHE